MKDQADVLRKKMDNRRNLFPKTMAVVSGKGGVGKSNFSLNFAISLSMKGHKVLLFDMDVGMGNIDILLGNSSVHTIIDFFEQREPLENIVTVGPGNIHYIAGGTGLDRLFTFDEKMFESFTKELSLLLEVYEFVIFDMGAGITEESIKFILSVDEIVLVTTPEPTSITDAYSMLKHIHLRNREVPFLVVVNRALSEKDGMNTYKRLQTVTRRFLHKEIKFLGMIPDDRAIPIAVSKQTPFILNSNSSATKALQDLTERFEKRNFEELKTRETTPFVSKLKRFLFER